VASTKKTARAAGLLYLLVVITAAFSLTYVPSRLIVRGDTTATVNNILASQTLYRMGIASDLLSTTLFIFLALALHRLLKGVNQRQAALMVVLVLIQVPIKFLNVVNEIAALTLLRGPHFFSVFDKPQRDALAMLFLHLHEQGIVVSQAFWGLWLFPFGALVYRSGFLPRVLGLWLTLNGLAYLILCFTGLLFPQFYALVFNSAMPAALGQMVMMLWLLIMGAKDQPLADPAS